MLNTSDDHGNANQNHNEISPVRLAIIKKTSDSTGKGVEKRESLCTVAGNVNWCSHYGKRNKIPPPQIKNRTTI